MKRVSLRMAIACMVLLIASRSFGADEIQTLLQDVEQLPKETPAGRMVADRAMARDMIEYGRRSKMPEAVIFGVHILIKNPVSPVKKAEDATKREKQELASLIDEALKMRPDDETLVVLVERVSNALDEATRGLAGGPKSWDVKIPKGGYYQLDPTLIYNAQEKALVTAQCKNVTLGASVRRSNQQMELKRAVGRDKIVIDWNSGIFTTGWDVRIYNLTGEGTVEVKVETN